MPTAIEKPFSTTDNLPPDPVTLSKPLPPAYPLSQGNLQDILEYSITPYGQVSVTSRVALPRNSHLCNIYTHKAAPQATWSSLQCSQTHHIELNSALVYINHSCAPTVEMVVNTPDDGGNYPNGVAGEVRVAQDRDLQVGDVLTFFYPSTDWESPRPFKCLCGAGEMKCIGMFRGSKYLSKDVLDQYFTNKHIDELVARRDQK